MKNTNHPSSEGTFLIPTPGKHQFGRWIEAKRRDAVLGKARKLAEAARAEARELTDAEASDVDAALSEAKHINTTLAADAKSRLINARLDEMAAASSNVLGGSGQHLALTGVHAKTMAEKIIAGMPRDNVSGKALVAGGTSTVSTILLPEIAVTGRPALSILDLLPTRIVPSPSYFFLRQTTRALAAAPTPPYSSKPVSDVGVTGIPNRLRVVATVSNPVDVFLLADNTNLAAFVSDECIYAVRLSLETEILSGDGTGEHMTGILNTSGVVTQAFVTSTLASIRHALATLQSTGYQPWGDRAVNERLA